MDYFWERRTRLSKYVLPSEIKTEMQLASWLYGHDLAFIIGYTAISLIFYGAVHPSLFIPYIAWNVLVGIILTRPSAYNPQKRIYHSLVYWALRRSKTYHPISLEEGDRHACIKYRPKKSQNT